VGSMGVVGQERFTAPSCGRCFRPSPLLIRSSRLVTRSRLLCCSVPCRPCVCALGNSCAGYKPTVRTGFLFDGQVGWNKGGSSEWDWAPVRDHSSLMILIPYAILAPRGPSQSSVCSPPTHTCVCFCSLKGCSGTGPRGPEAGPLVTSGLGRMRQALMAVRFRPPAFGPPRAPFVRVYRLPFFIYGMAGPVQGLPTIGERAHAVLARNRGGWVGSAGRGMGGGVVLGPAVIVSIGPAHTSLLALQDRSLGLDRHQSSDLPVLPLPPCPFPSRSPVPLALLQRALSLVRSCAWQQLRRFLAYGSNWVPY